MTVSEENQVRNISVQMEPIEENILWEDIERCMKSNDQEELSKIIIERGFAAVWRPADAPEKETSLHKASELGSIRSIKILIENAKSNGFSVDSPDCDGNTSLFRAVKSTQVESIKELLDANAHINARNDQGHSILHVIAYALSSSKEKDKQEKLIACLDKILDRPDIDLEAHNNSGFTPLLSAAKKMTSDEGVRRTNNLVLFCRKLLTKGASLEACDKNGLSVRRVLEDRSALPSVLMGERQSPPQRPFISQFLDSLLLSTNGEQVSELLSGQPQEEANRASNSYIGSQTVLFYVVDKCDLRAVEALLGAGADSWKEQLSGELCLHRALSKGNPEILNLLIDNMKNRKNVHQLDMRYQSFDLLERLLENQKKNCTNTEDNDRLKCLERILEADVLININKTTEGLVSQSILHVAASFNNQEALRLLLEKGAFLGCRKTFDGKDRGTILLALRRETLEKAMDGCITHHSSADEPDSRENVISPDYTLNFDYRFLIPPTNTESQDSPEMNEVKTLMEVSQNRTHRKAIKHPLIQTLLYAKWRKVLLLYTTNLLLYLAFAIVLTLFLYSLKDLRITEARASKLSVSNSTLEKDIETGRYNVKCYMVFLIPLMVYMLLREVFQIRYTFRTYLRNFENYLEWFLIIIVIILCSATVGVDTTRHLAAWTMIIAWYEFVLLLGRAPPLAIYVTMLRHVSWNFLKLIFLYGALILAFSVSFNIILQPAKVSEESETEFGNFWSTLPKSIVMATGEFDYSDLSSNFFSSQALFATSAVLVFLVFLFLIFLVLMNVMSGLAVSDTQEVMEEATLYSLKSRLELIYLIEEMLLVMPFFKKLFKVHLVSGCKHPQLFVKVNYDDKKQRISYGDTKQKFCKLDNETADVIRSYRLQLLSEEEERAKSDPMKECLNLLQELRDLAAQNPQILSPTTLSLSSSRGRLN